MLEPYAVKVVRRGVGCEADFLSDKIKKTKSKHNEKGI
jgi:hypothetical protein